MQSADDLTACRAALSAGRLRAQDALHQCLERAGVVGAREAYLRLDAPGASACAAGIDAAHAAGIALPPLAGLAVSIKDLFDVAGQTTTAGSRVLAGDAPAGRDAVSVARLRRAGAALVGRTHMTEFAYSGIGLNPHHPTPANVPMAAIDPQHPRIPGGSSSGAATSVASGSAWAALGSDTGGSIRIPAALQGLVGFKNTQALTSADGAVPLSPSLDTACAITRSVRDAVLLHEILADRTVTLPGRPLKATRLAVATTVMLDGLDDHVAAAFNTALATLSRSGAVIERIALPSLAELAPLQLHGGLPATESWAWHRHRLTQAEADYDPRVASRIRRGAAASAADYIDLLHARRRWIAALHAALRGVDAVISPTVPVVAPPIADLQADDDAFFRLNALMLRNPSVVNLLDGCAISLPCHAPGTPPVGLMLWSRGLDDDRLLDTALAVEAALAAWRRAGA